MRSLLRTTAFVLGVVAAPAAAQEPASPDGVPWRRDLAAARAEAAREHKPLLVVFRCER